MVVEEEVVESNVVESNVQRQSNLPRPIVWMDQSWPMAVLAIIAFVVASSISWLSYVAGLSFQQVGSTDAAAVVIFASAAVCSIWIALLPWWRAWAVSGSIISFLVVSAVTSTPEQLSLFMVITLAWSSAMRAMPLRLLALFGYGSIFLFMFLLSTADSAADLALTLGYTFLFTCVPTVFGYLISLLIAQNTQLEELDLIRREAAVSAERGRISRELHDVAAHHLTAVALQARTALITAEPADIEESVSFTAEAVEEALEALRNMVTVLQGSDEAPQPRMTELEPIIRRVRRTGIETKTNLTELDPDGTESLTHIMDVLELSNQLAAVRIVQEALTNALRHGNGKQLDLHFVTTTNWLRITVENDGGPYPMVHSEPDGNRHGLVGMDVRARACGGNCISGPTKKGWRVTATLPARSHIPATSNKPAP